MKLLRPTCVAVLSALALSATADDFPNKAIRFIMPYPIGGSIDIAGRMVAQRLADNLGQAVVVDNRTGANGNVGADHVAIGLDTVPGRSAFVSNPSDYGVLLDALKRLTTPENVRKITGENWMRVLEKAKA